MTPEPLAAPENGAEGAYVASLVVQGDPVPWTGKQTNPNTGNRFVPSRQAAAAGRIIDAWERSGQTMFPLGERLELHCTFEVDRPSYNYGTGRNFEAIKDRYRDARPTGRPDLSNLVKLVEDALTTLAWKDDDQIVKITAEKVYTAARQDPPRTRIWISTVA